jgi:ABC-type Fe3+/spermidine/putrescine transport system ATPase subunit
MTSTIEFRDIAKRFGGAPAVEHLHLSIERGEFVSLLGPSGCGKTTTLNMLAGFLTPDAGAIYRDGQEISSPTRVVPPERRRLSMIFQSYALWPHKTIAANIAYGLEVQRVPRPELRQRVDEMLDIVHLGGFGSRYPSELSGGQQQRVALARALVVRPDVLLMDEPLSNLDTALRETMRLEIRRLHERFGTTSIYVTHDQTEAMVMSDRIVVMNGGHKEQEGSPENVYDRPRNEFVAGFMGKMNFIRGTAHTADVVESGPLRVSVIPADGEPVAKGDRVTVGFRPHAAHLEADGESSDAMNALPARIERSIYDGSSREYIATVVGADGPVEIIVTHRPSDPVLPDGSGATLLVPRSQCLALRPSSPSTEERAA